MEVTFTLRLIDLLTAPAKAAKETLQGLVKTAGEAAKDSAKTAVDKVKQAGDATRDVARSTAENVGKATKTTTSAIAATPAATIAGRTKAATDVAGSSPGVSAQKRRVMDFLRDVGDAPASEPLIPDQKAARPAGKARATQPKTPAGDAAAPEPLVPDQKPARPAGKAKAAQPKTPAVFTNEDLPANKPKAPQPGAPVFTNEDLPPAQPVRKRRVMDFLRDVGDAPEPEVPATTSTRTKDDKKPGQKLGFVDMPEEAGATAEKTGGLVGRSVAMVKQRVAAAVAQSLGDKLSDFANTAIAGKLDAILSPLHAQMDGLKEQFPALAPHIDMVRGKIDAMAMALSGMATNAAGRAATSIASRVGSMAAGLIGWPGLLVAGAVLALANWTKVKAFFADLFGKLPEPVQAAMSKIGAILSATPLGAIARGFDQIASYVEKVFDAIVNGGEQRWNQLKTLLIDNPMQWVSGAWDGLKSYFSTLWNDLKANPRQALAGMASAVASEFKKIPLALTGVGISIIEAITGADLSRVRTAVENIINAFYEIPRRLIDLGGRIIDQIKSGDWTGAATTLATSFVDGLRTMLTGIGTLANEIVKAITGIDIASEASKLADKFVSTIMNIPDQLKELAGKITAAFAEIDLVDTGKQIINGLLRGMEAAFVAVGLWISAKAAEIKSKISNAIPSFLGGGGSSGPSSGPPSAPALQARARGGPVQAGGLYKVGEEGEELFVPDQDGQIINANDTRRLLMPANLPPSAPAPSLFASAGSGQAGSTHVRMEGGRSNSTVNHFQISVTGGQTDDPETFARRMWDEIEKSTRGSLNDGVDK